MSDVTPSDSLDEQSWLTWLEQRQASTNKSIKKGIGDDAAWLGASENIVTTDMLLEGRHFETLYTTPQQIGRKALAVSLSDCAAMAAKPYAAFISLAMSEGKHGSDFLKLIWLGLSSLADDYQVAIAGGDTNGWHQGLVISVTVLAKPHHKGPVFRCGANPGDMIFVTGSLGGSMLDGHHLSFKPRVAEAQWLYDHFPLSALIDLSDGLAADLPKLTAASNVGASIDAEKLPISAGLRHLAAAQKLTHALSDGEDFELLFTLPRSDGQRLLSMQPFADCTLTWIGNITSHKSLSMSGHGTSGPLPSGGFVHRL